MSETKAGARHRKVPARVYERVGASASRVRARVEALRERARRERGIRVRETFTVRGPAASETEARVGTVLAEAGCSRAMVGPGRYRYARSVRPLPLTVGGGVMSVITLGLTLPLLLLRRTEECAVSIEESPTGARVTVVGLVPAAALTRLRAGLGDRVWRTVAPAVAGSPPSVAEDRTVTGRRSDPPPVEGDTRAVGPAPRAADDGTRPSVDDRTRPPADDGTRPRAAPAVPVADDETYRRARPGPPPGAPRVVTTRVVLELDTGERHPVAASTVVGRHPDPSLGSPITVEDRERTISKSHLRVLVEPDGVWLEDLGSTNGTTIQSPDGRSTAVHPGRRYPVTPGCTVCFGDRRARLVRD